MGRPLKLPKQRGRRVYFSLVLSLIDDSEVSGITTLVREIEEKQREYLCGLMDQLQLLDVLVSALYVVRWLANRERESQRRYDVCV